MEGKHFDWSGLHNPAHLNEGMVWMVWQDGEVTLTKGGSLLGMRNIHQIARPLPTAQVPWDWMPEPSVNECGYAAVDERGAYLFRWWLALTLGSPADRDVAEREIAVRLDGRAEYAGVTRQDIGIALLARTLSRPEVHA